MMVECNEKNCSECKETGVKLIEVFVKPIKTDKNGGVEVNAGCNTRFYKMFTEEQQKRYKDILQELSTLIKDVYENQLAKGFDEYMVDMLRDLINMPPEELQKKMNEMLNDIKRQR